MESEKKETKKEKEKKKRFNVLYISATHWNILTIIVRRLSKNNKNRSKRVDFTV